MADKEAILRGFGLNDKGVTDTLKNAALTQSLIDLNAKYGANKLLYTVATKTPNDSHRDLLGKYIHENKIKSTVQLDAAIQFLQRHAEPDIAQFEEACGAGVDVSDAEIVQAVATVFQQDLEIIKTQRYLIEVGTYLRKVKDAPRMRWADGAKLKAEVDKQLYALLGDRTEEDARMEAEAKEKRKTKPQQPKEGQPVNPAAVAKTAEQEAKAALRKQMASAVDAVHGNLLYKRTRARIAQLLANAEDGKFPDPATEFQVAGIVKTVREQGKGPAFIAVNDGSTPHVLQAVLDPAAFANKDEHAQLIECGTGASVWLAGRVVKSPAKGQLIELLVSSGRVVGETWKDFPLQTKAKQPLALLRQHAHLRIRTNVISSVMRIRNVCAYSVHQFFQQRGFQYVHTPLITTNDCEGAGETFTVTNLVNHEGGLKQEGVNADGSINWQADFFGRKAMLTVSGQLNVETYAASLFDVYTFGPTFRAENSNTTRHLAEFWMIEPEVWFATLEDDMRLAEDFLKFVLAAVLRDCQEDLLALEKFHEENDEEAVEGSRKADIGSLISRLVHIASTPFARCTYTEAVKLIQEAEQAGHVKFQNSPHWGDDLASEHERYLTEKILKKPVIVTNYPKGIKAFYMKQSVDGKTVEAMDVLVPGIGEVIGGSAREDNFDKLVKRMEEMNIPVKGLEWYLDLRRHGSAPHAGFGLGFERLLLLCTGMGNIRDVIPFPRFPGHAEY